MEKIIQSFEGLIRRSIAPSITFFVLVGIVDLLVFKLAGGSAVERLKNGLAFLKDHFDGTSNVSFFAAAILIVGMSYSLAMVQQILFDNWLRKDFDPWPNWEWLHRLRAENSDGKILADLRTRVVDRLNTEPCLSKLKDLEASSDYLLYEILGGIDPTDTRKFVDSAKSLGITAISLMLGLLGGLLVHWSDLGVVGRFILVLLIPAIFVLGHSAVRTEFRTRALRLYVNFLAMPSERVQNLLLDSRNADDAN